MTEQEKFNLETQTKLAMQDAKFAVFMNELKEQREDMRRLNERIDAAQTKHEADIKDINARIDSKFDKLSEQMNDTWRQTMLGIGGMIVALGGLLIAVLR